MSAITVCFHELGNAGDSVSLLMLAILPKVTDVLLDSPLFTVMTFSLLARYSC